MSDSGTTPHLIRADAVKAAESTASHPWNPDSQLIGTHLSRLGGLERTGVSIVRIPGGKESFTYHLHHREEEWIYILSGSGIAEIDGVEHEVGPGDFMAFPAPSVAHHLRNSFDEELVYLMGGENRDCEIADFPRLGKRMVRLKDEVAIYDLESGVPFGPPED
ncbi:MAG: cupin domain-containing protein [Wenzhouxiangellaceae bacterium]|nr:cupin domain-containing protein [Wenzhouxiangellaceae bacterium]